jgi:multidrug efflux pump subunit AcrB
MLETSSDNLYLRVTGMLEHLEDIRNTPIEGNGRTFRLGDIAKVTRAYAEPTDPKFFYNGIGHINKELPAGLELHQTVDQPKVVESSINEFMESLIESVVIVLIVSFASLGMRSGIIVALCIPLVILIVFTAMNLFSIDLQRVSLGVLIIALSLLVDDAIITIEMIVVKMEQG